LLARCFRTGLFSPNRLGESLLEGASSQKVLRTPLERGAGPRLGRADDVEAAIEDLPGCPIEDEPGQSESLRKIPLAGVNLEDRHSRLLAARHGDYFA